mgnify:CR=1 FL=1
MMSKCPYDYKKELQGVACFEEKKCAACQKSHEKIQKCVYNTQQLLISNIHYMNSFISKNGVSTNAGGDIVYMDVALAKEKQKLFQELYVSLDKCK